MARLVPDFVSEDCRSSAERRFFERCRHELPEDVLVLHSLGVARHRYKVYSEADFVIVQRSAVIVVEMKGGRIARRDGAWFFTDRFGQMHRKKESPMQQAASVTAALRNAIRERFGRNSAESRVAFGYLAIFPDIEFSKPSPEWDLRRVCDISGWARPLREMIGEAAAYSREEMRRITEHDPAVLEAAELASLADFLRGDFERVPSLRVALDGHADDMVRLSRQQFQILDQTSRNPRIVIDGPAGTGKTLIAFESARRHAAAGRRVLFVCFSRLLAEHLKLYARRHRAADNITIGTLHGHCMSVLKAAGRAPAPGVLEGEVFRDEIPRQVAESFPLLKDFRPWDVLVMDEGQDIAAHGPFMQALAPMLAGGFENGRWIWFEDPRQRILRQGAGPVFDLDRFKPSYFTLTRNWRNTNEVATYTAAATRLPLPELSGIAGPKVKSVCVGADCARSIGDLVLGLIADGCPPASIVLLTARAEEHASFLPGGTVAGMRLVRYDPCAAALQGEIRYSSVYRFKGLEAQAIVLADVEDLEGETARMAAYVGMSRANSVLCVALSAAAKRHFDENLLSPAAEAR